jgi:ribosomal protein L24E
LDGLKRVGEYVDTHHNEHVSPYIERSVTQSRESVFKSGVKKKFQNRPITSFLSSTLPFLPFSSLPRASHTTTGIRRITIDEHPLKSSSNMVIKTQLCAFSENRIYPGHGSMCCRRDGQTFWLGTKKAKSMYNQRKKPQKLAWTQAWRRLHKKNIDNRQKKKVSSSNSSDHHMMMTIVAVWF